MTIPHARKITVDGVEYFYALKRLGKPRRIGDSPGRMMLVVQMTEGEYVTAAFESKTWTGDHENGEYWAPEHKVGFLPNDVALVIKALAFHGGVLPASLILSDWRSIQVSTKPRQKVQVRPQPSRHSVGEHLSADDLQAVTFEDPALTVDFARAQLHVKSCGVCRDTVERERDEAPLLEPEGV